MKMELDRSNALLTGVCAGFARSADVDLVLTRVTMVLITLFFAPIAIPAYLLAAALLKPQSERCARAVNISKLYIRYAAVRGVYGL